MAKFTKTTTYEIRCPACQSENVVKKGVRNEQQRYLCRECNKSFRASGKAEGRRMDADLMGAAIGDYYDGKSYKKIAEAIEKEYDIPEPSKATIYEWVRDYTKEAVDSMEDVKVPTGGNWVADEMVVKVGGQKAYNWNVMDEDTRYILASYLSHRRDGHAARAAIRKAAEAADKPPKSITTDKWRAYIKPIKDILPGAKHVQSEGLSAELNNNLSERLQGTFRDRTKTLRGLESIESGQRYLDGWVLNYNLFRKHESLGNRTPAEVAKITVPYQEWADVVKVDAAVPLAVVEEARRVEIPKAERPQPAPPTRPESSNGKAPSRGRVRVEARPHKTPARRKGRAITDHPHYKVRKRGQRPLRRGR